MTWQVTCYTTSFKGAADSALSVLSIWYHCITARTRVLILLVSARWLLDVLALGRTALPVWIINEAQYLTVITAAIKRAVFTFQYRGRWKWVIRTLTLLNIIPGIMLPFVSAEAM